MPRNKPGGVKKDAAKPAEVTEIEGPVTIEITPPEIPGDYPPLPPVQKPTVKDNQPVAKPMIKRGTVLLRYSGESPLRAVKDVPSKSAYRIGPNGTVTVYPEDADKLLENSDFTRIA